MNSQVTFSTIWKIAGTSLAIVPGIYGVVFFMVQAVSIDIEHRLTHLENEAAKGSRFTASDGARLGAMFEDHSDHHNNTDDNLRKILDTIKYDDATFKANINVLNTRFARIEDKIYTSNFDLPPKRWAYKNAPYKTPQKIYSQPDMIPLNYSFSHSRGY